MDLFRRYRSAVLVFLLIEIAVGTILTLLYLQRRESLLQLEIERTGALYKTVRTFQDRSLTMLYDMLDAPEITGLLERAAKDEAGRTEVRQQLYTLLNARYGKLVLSDLRILHFHLPDGTSFLRLHNPSHFGTSLIERPSIQRVNSEHKALSGFESCNYYSGIRNVYPLFGTKGEYIGSVEISYRPRVFLDAMAAGLAAHVELYARDNLLRKDIFAEKKLYVGGETLNKEGFETPGMGPRHGDEDEAEMTAHIDTLRSILLQRGAEHLKDVHPYATDIKIADHDDTVVIYPVESMGTDLPGGYMVVYMTNGTLERHYRGITTVFGITTLLNMLLMVYIARVSRTRELEATRGKLEHRTRVIGMLAESIKTLATSPAYADEMDAVLHDFVETLGVCHAYLVQNERVGEDTVIRVRFRNVAERARETHGRDGLCDGSYADEGVQRWLVHFAEGGRIEGNVANLPAEEAAFLRRCGVISVLALPVFVEERLWGFVALDCCSHERVWSDTEKRAVEVFAMTLSGVMNRELQHRRLEELSAEQQRRIEEAVALNRQQERIMYEQARYAQQGEMISMIAHQWRQPLNAINAAAIKLHFKYELGELGETEIEEVTRFIQSEAKGMSQVINDFMNFFKPESEKSLFSLDDVAREALKMIEAQMKNRDILCEMEISPEIAIFGHRKEFIHILLNLFSNARDALNESAVERKRIRLSAHTDAQTVTLRLCDNGPGIPAEILERIFDPYFTTKEQGKGTGIGLYMVKEMVLNDFGGRISALNLPEGGACFTIELPLPAPEQLS